MGNDAVDELWVEVEVEMEVNSGVKLSLGELGKDLAKKGT